MKASELRKISIKNNPDTDALDIVYRKMREEAAKGKFSYTIYPDPLPDRVIKELKKQGYSVKVASYEYSTTETTISWD